MRKVNHKCVDKRNENNEQKFQCTLKFVEQINVQCKLDLQNNIS